jgi:hypothetical protein
MHKESMDAPRRGNEFCLAIKAQLDAFNCRPKDPSHKCPGWLGGQACDDEFPAKYLAVFRVVHPPYQALCPAGGTCAELDGYLEVGDRLKGYL